MIDAESLPIPWGKKGKTEGETIDTDVGNLVYVISNPKRREIIRVLNSIEKEISLSELTRRVADRTTDDDVEIGSDSCHSVYVSLYQTHLPKLEDINAVQLVETDGELAIIPTPTTSVLSEVIGYIDSITTKKDDDPHRFSNRHQRYCVPVGDQV